MLVPYFSKKDGMHLITYEEGRSKLIKEILQCILVMI